MDLHFFCLFLTYIIGDGETFIPHELLQSPQFTKVDYLHHLILFLSRLNEQEYNEMIEHIRLWISNNPSLIHRFSQMLLIISKDESLIDDIAELVADLENDELLEYIAAVPFDRNFNVPNFIALFHLNHILHPQPSIQLTTIYKVLTSSENDKLINMASAIFNNWCNTITTMFSKEWIYQPAILSGIDWTMIGKLIGCFVPAKENKHCGDGQTASWQSLVRHFTNFLHFHQLIIIYDNIDHPWSRHLFVKTMLSSLLIQDWGEGMVQTIRLNGEAELEMDMVGMGQFLQNLRRWDKVPLFQHLVRECMPKSKQLMNRECGQKVKMGKKEKEFVDMCEAHLKDSQIPCKRPRE